MAAIIYLITFRFMWDRPEQAGSTFTPPKAGTVVWTTLSTTSYTEAKAVAQDIMDGAEDSAAGFVTTISVVREDVRKGTKRTALAQRDRVVGCSCGDHQVHSRAGRWVKGAERILSTDICARMQGAA